MMPRNQIVPCDRNDCRITQQSDPWMTLEYNYGPVYDKFGNIIPSSVSQKSSTTRIECLTCHKNWNKVTDSSGNVVLNEVTLADPQLLID